MRRFIVGACALGLLLIELGRSAEEGPKPVPPSPATPASNPPATDPLADPSGWPVISLPLGDGTTARFAYEETHVLPPGLAKKYAHKVRTYRGRGVERPDLAARFEQIGTYVYYHVLLQNSSGTILTTDLKDQVPIPPPPPLPADDSPPSVPQPADPMPKADATGSVALPAGTRAPRCYRLAMACTGEFGQANGGNQEEILPWIAVVVNRLNGIYERDLGITFQLVEQNECLL